MAYWRKCFGMALFIPLLLASCKPEPAVIEVTRVTEVTVEVTRPPEVIVEATDTLRDLFYRYEEVVVTRVVGTELQAETGQQILALLDDNVEGVEQVDLISWSEGLLEVELVTSYPGKDAQPAVAWVVINNLARLLAPMTQAQRLELTGSDQLDVQLTTTSIFGDHLYRSRTDFETMRQLSNQELTQEAWAEQAGAVFP